MWSVGVGVGVGEGGAAGGRVVVSGVAASVRVFSSIATIHVHGFFDLGTAH